MLHLVICALLLTGPGLDPAAARMRDGLERMHTAMQATFKRDRGAVERFYTAGATITEAARSHTGRASLLDFWTSVPWSRDWTHETFDLGTPDHGVPWEAGRYTAQRADGARVETFYVRLLHQAQDGEWKILGEALSADPGSGTAADLAAASERWLKTTTPGADAVEGQLARIYGSLGVSRASARRAGRDESCTAIWIQSRSAWRLAEGRCQPAS